MPNDNHNQPDNELDMFEAFAAQIFGGTFNVIQDVLSGGSGHIVINDSQTTAGPPTWDDGSDFRKLAKTKRRNDQPVLEEDKGNEELREDVSPRSWRSPITEQEQPSQSVISTNARPTSLLDLLFRTHTAFQSQGDSAILGNGDTEGSSWNFSSSSSRTISLPDGSQETVIKKSVNGVTETIRKVQHPDGTTVETIEPSVKGLDWKAPLQSIEQKVNRAWEDSQPEIHQSMAELDKAASSLSKAYTGIREGIANRFWNAFIGENPKETKDIFSSDQK
ncbi:hypothetical protein K450DRAFT_282574 [Umbelopsis ramanniana AG]|uniref:Uncharacterized protein n=1 Tax=Umbelopsis ramanniana AG TaxID=1314678 RepID=A0AAD5HAV6_UMBRA|nr:uncharacterized protein K450DRAFT_282574 [Umbelopsis ramanniana AG]KAI8577485.1 hypothetical protein K450DRAFT_282574 [Umbelopsis ramanniana AG]